MKDLKQKVEHLVSQIPVGSVMTYGQIAALCGSPRAARVVGGIAHFGNPLLPWHRVVNKQGKLASGYHGGARMQKQHLEEEGVKVSGDNGVFYVDMKATQWHPFRENK